MHHRCLLVRDFASEFFEGYIYLRTLLVSIDWNKEREFEWIIIVSHQIEKERFEEYRSVNFQDQCDDHIYLSRSTRQYFTAAFYLSTGQQISRWQRERGEGVSCDARGKLLNSCFCGGDHWSGASRGQWRVSKKYFDSMHCNFSFTRRQGSTSQFWRGWFTQVELQHS